MANSLLITKLSDDSFSFVVNGDVVNTITNLRNDITTVGNEIHVKTSEGANLIKLQQILYNEVTIVDGGTLPVASSPLDLRIKLRSVGFWDWLTTGGSGVDRFDELSDTFAYFGNDGKIPMVDESQLKLIAFTLPDTSYLNLFPSPLEPLRALRVNASGDAYEFYDAVNVVTQEIRSGYTETAPSEDVVYNSFELKLNSGGYSGTGQDLKNEIDVKTENSAGAVQGFTVTNNGDGTVNISSGVAYLRGTNDQYAPLVKYTIPSVANLVLTDNANNYVLVDYNGGSPALTVTTNAATINTETNSLAILISRVGTVLDWLSLVGQNNDSNAKLRVRFLNQEGIRRANGAIIGFASRNLTLTAGTLFSGLIRINSPAFNTVTPDTFTYVYNNGSVWTRVTGQTQVNNTQYNNGGTLTTMPASSFRVDYVYLLPNNPSKLYVVYGSTTYANITLARNAPTPTSLPSELQVLGLLVGRQIIQRNAPSISEVTSAFTDVFAGVGVPEHNALAGLQGGAVNDYQHLTTAQLSLLEYISNKQNSLTADGTGFKYPTLDVLNLLIRNNTLGKNLDAITVKDGNDLGYIKIGQNSLALNTAVTLDNFASSNMKKYQNKFKLYAGRKYKLTAKLRTSFTTNTSFNRFCFYDETRGVYIDTAYPYKGGGTTNIQYGTDFAGNNPTIDTVTAVIFPEQNIFVSLKMVQLTGTIVVLDNVRTYSCITIEEVGTQDVEVLVSVDTPFVDHMQGMVYTTDYPTVFFASLTDRIVKIDLATGAILQTLSYTSHVGGICYFNGKIYAGYTLLANFNNPSPVSQVLEIDPVTTTLIRAVNNTGAFAFGAIGTNGTDMYIGYGSTLISNGRIQKIDPVTLLLTGSVITIANVGNEFGNGIQTIDYFNGLWYFGTHLGGLVTDPFGFNGGGLVTLNNSFVVQNIYKRESGDWADGWGNGFIQYKGKIYWSEPNSLETPFTHRIRELIL